MKSILPEVRLSSHNIHINSLAYLPSSIILRIEIFPDSRETFEKLVGLKKGIDIEIRSIHTLRSLLHPNQETFLSFLSWLGSRVFL